MADRGRSVKIMPSIVAMAVVMVVAVVVVMVTAAFLEPWPPGRVAAAAAAAAGSGLGSGTDNDAASATVATGTASASGTASGMEAFTRLFREGLQKHRESDHAAAAALFGQAEQAAVMTDEKAQAAYFQGNAFFEAREYQRAEQSFQRVAAYGQEQAQVRAQAQESTQRRNTTLAKYVGLAEIAGRDCAACLNPLADFPTSMYLWIKINRGTAALASVDRYFNAWDSVKVYCYVIILLILFWRVLIKIRRRKTKKAGIG